MAANAPQLVLAIVAIIVFAVIYAPIIAFYAHKIKLYEHHTVMMKRHARLTVVLSILSIAWILSFIIGISISTFAPHLQALSNFFIIAIYTSFTYTLIWRLWSVYFNIIYSISLSQLSWQQLIHTEAGANNWYISEKTMSKWGNPEWVKKVMILAILVNMAVVALFTFINLGTLSVIIRFIIILVPWVGITWIYNRIPSFHDDIGIAEEIRYIMRVYVVQGIFFVLLIVVISLVNPQDSDVLIDILTHLTYHLVAFSAFAVSMIMTWWPLKKFVYIDGAAPVPNRVRDSSTSVRPPEMAGFKEPRFSLKLQDICLSMFGLDLLMKFLEKEYSRENLLFIVEVTLLQKSIRSHVESYSRLYAKQAIDVNEMSNSMFVLPSTCPESTIVEVENQEMIEKYSQANFGNMMIGPHQRKQIHFKYVCYELYMKYVANSSELAVNISSANRAALYFLVNDKEKWMKNAEYNDIVKVFNLYQEAKEEVIKLIKSDSLPRFRNKPEYQRVVDLMEKVKAKVEEQQPQSPDARTQLVEESQTK